MSCLTRPRRRIAGDAGWNLLAAQITRRRSAGATGSRRLCPTPQVLTAFARHASTTRSQDSSGSPSPRRSSSRVKTIIAKAPRSFSPPAIICVEAHAAAAAAVIVRTKRKMERPFAAIGTIEAARARWCGGRKSDPRQHARRHRSQCCRAASGTLTDPSCHGRAARPGSCRWPRHARDRW